jgi:hypothetical protein
LAKRADGLRALKGKSAMRNLTHLLVTAVLLILLGANNARATEVLYSFPTNTTFATAISNPPEGPSQAVFVTRTVAPKEGLTTFVSVYYTSPSGCFFAAGGYVPNNAFLVNANGANLDVDTTNLGFETFFSTCGESAPSGVISVAWSVTGTQRTSGSSAFQFGNITYRFTGTRREDVSNITGTLFGVTLIDPLQFSYISSLHNTVIIIERN